MPLHPGETFGRYVIEERLGAGGMGEVFRARDTKLERRVALKVLRSGRGMLDTEGAARILREARVAAAINHPNAVTIHDVGEVGDVPFIAMELVEGRALRAFVGDRAIPIERRIEWLLDVARALVAAHAKHLVHRDIKPENVMIRDGDGAVKVLDFGIARQAAGGDPSGGVAPTLEPITKDGAIAGTPTYMAPEQLRNEPIDGRADQFAWGTMAFELLAGSLPWRAPAGSFEVVAEILHAPPANPRERDAAIPDAFGAAIKRALAKRPEDRFASMEALIDHVRGNAVSPLAATETISEEQLRVATGAEPRRKRRVRAAALVIGAAALVAGICAVVLARKGEREAVSLPLGSAATTTHAASPSPSYVARILVPRARDRSFDFAVDADATEVAYVEGEDVWLVSVETGARTRLPMPEAAKVFGSDYSLAFLPDGRLLVGSNYDRGLPLVIVARDGSFVTTARRAESFSLSADGKSVWWERGGTLYSGDLEGKVATAVTQLPDLVLAWALSPDGKQFAFVRARSGGAPARLETMSADGRESRIILQSNTLADKNGVASVTWPAADAIAYVEYGASSVLREQRVDSHGAPVDPPRTLWESATQVPERLEARQGRFFFTWGEAKDDVAVAHMTPKLDAIEGDIVPITPSGSNDVIGGWLPDGRALITSDRDGADRIFAQGARSGEPELLLATEHRPVLAWGAIGRDAFAAYTREGDAFHIFRATTSGTLADLGTFATAKGVDDVYPCAPCVSGPPARCVFGEAIANETSFRSIDPSTGAVSLPFARVSLEGGERRCALSPDGASITVPTRGGFLRIAVRDGARREVLISPHLELVQFARPLPDGEHYFVSGLRFGDEWFAWLYVDANGHAAPIRASRAEWMFSPFLSPNGRDVALRVRSFESDLWVLEPSAR